MELACLIIYLCVNGNIMLGSCVHNLFLIGHMKLACLIIYLCVNGNIMLGSCVHNLFLIGHMFVICFVGHMNRAFRELFGTKLFFNDVHFFNRLIVPGSQELTYFGTTGICLSNISPFICDGSRCNRDMRRSLGSASWNS